MTSQRTVLEDDRGAIMIIAVFFAAFAVSMLYLAIGIGETVLFREHLQDAADSAALSAAITHARIMNVLVLINMVMAVLLAILVTLKLIEGVAYVGMAIAAGLAWLTGGSSLAAIPPLQTLQSTMETIYNEVEPSVFEALELLHDVADIVIEIGPEASEAVVKVDMDDNRSVVSAGFAAPTAPRLPVEPDAYEELCGKAGELAMEIANIPFHAVPPIAAIMDLLNEPMGTIARSLSTWFCGDGNNSLPSLDQSVDRGYPRSDQTQKCEEAKMPPQMDSQAEVKPGQECIDAEAERSAAEPAADGTCQGDCGPGSAFDLTTTLARESCNPNQSPAPFAYRYQQQQMRITYKWNGKLWVRGEPEIVSSWLVQPSRDARSGPPPCGSSDQSPTVAEGYNPAVHPAGDPVTVQPACSTESAPGVPEDPDDLAALNAGKVPTVVTFDYQQVTHVFACLRNVTVSVPVKQGKAASDAEGNTKSPRRVEADALLGGEQFQIRAIMLGNVEQQEAARLVRLGLWGRPDPKNPLASLKDLGKFSLAQAEYFYDAKDAVEDRAAWMWNMNWRARITRFRLPADRAAKSALVDLCSHSPGMDCSRILDVVEDWNELLVH